MVLARRHRRSGTESNAAAAEQDFFRGKTIRIVVGFAAGGGFDAYARIIARHMGRHIPGNPAMIVDNMTGAGSRVAANYLFRAPRRWTDYRQLHWLSRLAANHGRQRHRVRRTPIRVAWRAGAGRERLRPDQSQRVSIRSTTGSPPKTGETRRRSAGRQRFRRAARSEKSRWACRSN